MFHLIDGKIAEWGDPDLGGVWDFRTLTPIERPDALGDKEFLTSEEAAAFEEQSLRQWDADRRDGADQDFGIGSDIERAYNNNVQLFQTPDTVVIFNEMIHDARIVPLDGRPHLDDGIRQWMGDPRGRKRRRRRVRNSIRTSGVRTGLAAAGCRGGVRNGYASSVSAGGAGPAGSRSVPGVMLPGNYAMANMLSGARDVEAAAAAKRAGSE